jgi:hypothetical protein
MCLRSSDRSGGLKLSFVFFTIVLAFPNSNLIDIFLTFKHNIHNLARRAAMKLRIELPESLQCLCKHEIGDEDISINITFLYIYIYISICITSVYEVYK